MTSEKDVTIAFRCHPQLEERIKQLADRMSIPTSAACRLLIECGLHSDEIVQLIETFDKRESFMIKRGQG
jgi:predicted DNA-binding protein